MITAAPGSGVDVRRLAADEPAPAVQLLLVVEDVPASVGRAVGTGAVLVAEPVTKPWGQVVAYVRDRNGVLVELTSVSD